MQVLRVNRNVEHSAVWAAQSSTILTGTHYTWNIQIDLPNTLMSRSSDYVLTVFFALVHMAMAKHPQINIDAW